MGSDFEKTEAGCSRTPTAMRLCLESDAVKQKRLLKNLITSPIGSCQPGLARPVENRTLTDEKSAKKQRAAQQTRGNSVSGQKSLKPAQNSSIYKKEQGRDNAKGPAASQLALNSKQEAANAAMLAKSGYSAKNE